MIYFLLITVVLFGLKFFHVIKWPFGLVFLPFILYVIWFLIKLFYDLIFNRKDSDKDDGYA